MDSCARLLESPISHLRNTHRQQKTHFHTIWVIKYIHKSTFSEFAGLCPLSFPSFNPDTDASQDGLVGEKQPKWHL